MSKTKINQKDISNQVISMGKEYKTRDGSKVEILTTSRDHEFNVVVLMGGTVMYYLPNGKINNSSVKHFNDLVEVTNIEEGLNTYDLVMVSDNGRDWHLRFFRGYEDCKANAFINGRFEGFETSWEYCRKATPQEIVANKDSLG